MKKKLNYFYHVQHGKDVENNLKIYVRIFKCSIFSSQYWSLKTYKTYMYVFLYVLYLRIFKVI